MGKLNVPKGSHVVNPLISTSDARKLIEFLELVFDAREDKNALAIDEADDKVFNSSVTIGDTPINIFDRKDGWKHMPALLQVYVSELDKKLEIAKKQWGGDCYECNRLLRRQVSAIYRSPGKPLVVV